jgi:hypothetical protein
MEAALSQAPVHDAPLSRRSRVRSRSVRLPHEDPADRFLAATADIYELTLVTADERPASHTRVPDACQPLTRPRREALRGISLAHLTVLDTTPPELIGVAAAAGFPSVGIRLTATPSVGVPPYDMLREGPMLRETLAPLAHTGVAVLDTEFCASSPRSRSTCPSAERAGESAEPDEARTLERFCELCDRAAPHGLHVYLEFAIHGGVRTLAHATQFAARLRRPNAAVLIDALNFSRQIACRRTSPRSATVFPGAPREERVEMGLHGGAAGGALHWWQTETGWPIGANCVGLGMLP